jgi:hypothetical protein
VISNGADLVRILKLVYGTERPPKPLHLLLAAERVRAGEDLAAVASEVGTTRGRLHSVVEADDPATLVLKGAIPTLTPERERRVRRSLGQLLLGNLAERAFEDIYKGAVGSEFDLQRDRSLYTDTDYRVLNGKKRPVFRINIKG